MNGSARVPACLAPEHSGAPVPVPPSTDNWTAMAHEWQLRDFLELGALPGAVPCARYHVRQVLWEWRLTDLPDSAETGRPSRPEGHFRLQKFLTPGGPKRTVANSGEPWRIFLAALLCVDGALSRVSGEGGLKVEAARPPPGYVSGIPGHHLPRAEARKARQPGDDHAGSRGGRLGQQ